MRLIACLILLLGGLMQAFSGLSIEVMKNSTTVARLGEEVHFGGMLRNENSTPIDGSIDIRLIDFHGAQSASRVQPLVLGANAAKSFTVQLHPEQAGYYAICAKACNGASSVANFERIWSLAIFDHAIDVPGDSPFGTYIIGNVKMLADIVPRGFFKNMVQAGVKWGTLDTWWKRLEPTAGAYHWDYYERWFKEALAVGITPIPHLFGIPDWASSYKPGKPSNPWLYPPSDWKAWDKFVYDFVTRYKDWLVYLRIWNEPNTGYWQGTPADYAKLVIIASQAARRAKPDIKIIIEAAATANYDPFPFFDAVDAAGATPYWDLIAIHNYFLNNVDYPERTRFVPTHDAFIQWRNSHKPNAEAWDTEFACMADDWGTEWKGVGEVHQAQWLARSHVLAFSKGLKKLFWFPGYSWPDPTTPPYYNPSGLLRADLTPRPAYVAYRTIASALSRAVYDRSLPLAADQYAMVFWRPGGYVTTLWSVDAKHAGRIALKFEQSSPVEVIGLMGQRHSRALDAARSAAFDISEEMILVCSETPPKVQ